jgi:hypothetical protein
MKTSSAHKTPFMPRRSASRYTQTITSIQRARRAKERIERKVNLKKPKGPKSIPSKLGNFGVQITLENPGKIPKGAKIKGVKRRASMRIRTTRRISPIVFPVEVAISNLLFHACPGMKSICDL